jgi:hypothetical protein
MAKLKLTALSDEKPVKVAVDLPARLHRDLLAYAEILAHQSGQPISEPTKLIVPMLARFLWRRTGHSRDPESCAGKVMIEPRVDRQ